MANREVTVKVVMVMVMVMVWDSVVTPNNKPLEGV